MSIPTLDERRAAWRDMRRVARRMQIRRDAINAATNSTERSRLLADQRKDNRLRSDAAGRYNQLCAAIRRGPQVAVEATLFQPTEETK